jgi:hypothetical protein
LALALVAGVAGSVGYVLGSGQRPAPSATAQVAAPVIGPVAGYQDPLARVMHQGAAPAAVAHQTDPPPPIPCRTCQPVPIEPAAATAVERDLPDPLDAIDSTPEERKLIEEESATHARARRELLKRKREGEITEEEWLTLGREQYVAHFARLTAILGAERAGIYVDTLADHFKVFAADIRGDGQGEPR